MANDLEELVLSISADTKQIQRALKKLEGESNSSTKRIEKQFDSLGQKINRSFDGMTRSLNGSLKSFGIGVASGMTAALAPMALISTALDTINEASRLVDTADRLGITTTALQELAFGFSQAGVEASDFETGMDQFTRRIGEAATKGGRLADILQANGVALRDSNGQIRSSEALLADYADLMKNAATEQERMVLATEAFGRGGASFTVALKDGAAGIDDIKKAAADAGGVIDEQLLRRAEEMGDRWEAAWRRFKVNAQSAILTALKGMDSLNEVMKRFQESRAAVEGGALAGSLAGTVPDGKGDRLTGANARIDAAFLGELVKADDALVEALRKRYAEANKTVIPPSSDGGGGSTKEADPFKPARDGFAEMIGYTESYREQQEKVNQSVEDFGDMAVSAANSLATALADGKLEAQELIPMLQNVVTELIRMAQAAGGFGNLFGSVFGGGFNPSPGGFASMIGIPRYAKGTNNHPGGLAIVGEKGPELLNLPRGSQVIPRVPAANQGVVVQVINNSSGTKTREEKGRGPNGQELRRIIVEDIKAEFATGGFDKPFQARYGAQPVKTVR